MRRRHTARRQRGQAMVETVIVASILFLLLYGALQFAFIYHAKITLNYAAFEAARAGALNNARMPLIENAFARALAPLYTHDDSGEEVKRARCVVRTEMYGGDHYACQAGAEAPPGPVTAEPGATSDVWVRIDIVNPRPEHFLPANHGIEVDGGYEIPNDNLMYRPDTVKAGVNIQDANLLKIHVTYCFPMVVPFVNRTIATLLRERLAPPGGSLESRCLDAEPHPRIPLHAAATVRMQSPAFLPAS